MDGQPVDPSKWNQDPFIPILSENIDGKWVEIERDKSKTIQIQIGEFLVDQLVMIKDLL